MDLAGTVADDESGAIVEQFYFGQLDAGGELDAGLQFGDGSGDAGGVFIGDEENRLCDSILDESDWIVRGGGVDCDGIQIGCLPRFGCLSDPGKC